MTNKRHRQCIYFGIFLLIPAAGPVWNVFYQQAKNRSGSPSEAEVACAIFNFSFPLASVSLSLSHWLCVGAEAIFTKVFGVKK